MKRTTANATLAGVIIAMGMLLASPLAAALQGGHGPQPLGLKKVQVIAPAGLSGDPGENITYLFYVKNVGNDSDAYSWRAASDRPAWVISGPSTGTTELLGPGNMSGAISVVQHIDSAANAFDKCNITFTAWSQTDGFSVNSSASTLSTANPISSVTVTPPADATAYPGDNATLAYTVTNNGNWNEDTFEMSAEAQFGWKAYVSAPTMTIARGASAKCTVKVQIPSFSPAWSDSDFAKNGTFYNTKGLVTLLAHSRYMPVTSSGSASIRILPYYAAGVEAMWDKGSVDYYNESSSNVHNEAVYLLKVVNMNNYPSKDGGASDVTLAVTPPQSWYAHLDPPGPYRITGRDFITVRLFVTAPPEQESRLYTTKIVADITPQAGTVSDPVLKPSPPNFAEVTTVVGMRSAVAVTPVDPLVSAIVTADYVEVGFKVLNWGSGEDMFMLWGSTPDGWQVRIRNGSSLQYPANFTIARNSEVTVYALVTVPDGTKAGQVQNLTMRAVSTKDPVNGNSSAVSVITIETLYRVRILTGKAFLPIAPGGTVEFNYTVANLGSNKETVRVTYIREPGKDGWDLTEPSDLTLPSNSQQDGVMVVTSPLGVAWHDQFTVIVRGEVRNTADDLMTYAELNLTVEVRMLLVADKARNTDDFTVVAMPGDQVQFLLTSWNIAETADVISVQIDNMPVGWNGYINTTMGLSANSSDLPSQREQPDLCTYIFKLVVNVPATAGESEEAMISLSARNNVYRGIHDSVFINISLVVLDLAITGVWVSSDSVHDDDRVNITVEVSAGYGGLGVSKDAANVEIAVVISADGYAGFTQVVTLTKPVAKGTKVNVTVSWTAPKFKWYERSKSYQVSISVVTPDESSGANLENNRAQMPISVTHRTTAPVVSALIVVIAGIVFSVFFLLGKELLRLKFIWKFLSFTIISILIGSVLAAVFLLPLGALSIPVLLILMAFPLAFAVYFYTLTRSVVIGVFTGLLSTSAMGLVIGICSGGTDYVSAVFTESGTGIPAAFSVYLVIVMVVAAVFSVFSRWLWGFASDEIIRVEQKIRELKSPQTAEAEPEP